MTKFYHMIFKLFMIFIYSLGFCWIFLLERTTIVIKKAKCFFVHNHGS